MYIGSQVTNKGKQTTRKPCPIQSSCEPPALSPRSVLRGLVPSGATGFALRSPSRGLRALPARLAWTGEAPVLEHVVLDAPGRRSWGRKKGSRQRVGENLGYWEGNNLSMIRIHRSLLGCVSYALLM